MSRRFDYFVVFAEMRTGSNFLEANLNCFPGLQCHGELFNPHFIGGHNSFEFMGFTMDDRAADPLRLITRLRKEAPLSGFRYFHDHDPRVLAHCLPDPRCAKIILSRNPIDSYVSLKIAKATGQWKLTNVTRHKAAQARFDAMEFEEHLQDLQDFQVRLAHGLQTTGQTAFHIAYEDLHDIDVLNGLARFLGEETQLEGLAKNLKKQNPEPIREKVVNPDEMVAALARLDRFNLSRTPNFEPRRGPSVPSFSAGAQAPLLFMPVKSGPEKPVLKWLAALDRVPPEELRGSFTQKSLNQWMADHPGHRSFTVLRHPLLRAHVAFTEHVLNGKFAGIRDMLRKNYGLALPAPNQRDGYGSAEHRADFLGFLSFLKGNLSGQSAVRVDASWASQGAVLRGFADFLLPDLVLRESELPSQLERLAAYCGRPAPQAPAAAASGELAAIYDEDLEAAARAAYGRDYLEFGFGRWSDAPLG